MEYNNSFFTMKALELKVRQAKYLVGHLERVWIEMFKMDTDFSV